MDKEEKRLEHRDIKVLRKPKRFLFEYPWSSVFIRGKRLLLFFILSVALFGLSSCAEVAKDMGFDVPSDIEQRTGPAGTQNDPAVLDPFQKYNFVMAANECRFFMMKVPEKWYWKVFLTADNRDPRRKGHLSAEIISTNPPWAPLPDSVLNKNFDLDREGVQAVLGIGNNYPKRIAVLKLCQDGAPVHITIASQVSTTTGLIGPKKDEVTTKDQ